MREEVPDGRSRPEPKRKRPRVRRAPLPYDVVFRMSYVVTLAYLDANGETLAARRYAAPASDDPTTVVSRAAEDIRAALTKKKKENGTAITIGLVQDGAPEMWNLGREALQAIVNDGLIPKWFEALDRCHLMGRLGSALDSLSVSVDERDDILDDWSRRLDQQDSAIDGIELWLKNRADAATERQRDAVAEHLTYIKNNKDRMRYVTMLNRGLPVGSGVTESAAKTVINARTKRSGQRWTEDGLRGVLALRGLLQSRRLPAFWRSLSRRFVANVTCAEAA